MEKHVCPWWIGYLLVNPVRRWLQDPEKILGPYVRGGMTVLDIGPGMGFFTLPAARMVGESGRLIAVDVQDKMLKALVRRAEKAGLAERIHALLCSPQDIGVSEPVDVCLLFNVVHEVPDPNALFSQIRAVLKHSGKILLTEPRFHVSESDFQGTLETARAHGLKAVGDFRMGRARSALLEAV